MFFDVMLCNVVSVLYINQTTFLTQYFNAGKSILMKILGRPINYSVTWVANTFRSQSQNKMQRGLVFYL